MTQKHFVIFIGSLKKGGAERNAALLANFLVARGHAVTLAIFIREIAFDLDPRVNISIINHKRFGSKAMSSLYVYYKLRSLVNKLRPKRLVAMSRIGSLISSAIVYPNTTVRFDIYPLLGYKKYKQWLCWFYYNMPWVKYVVCPSRELMEDVSGYFINKKKLVTIYNPVPLVNDPDRNVVIPARRPYFVIVARLHVQKNIHQVIESFHRAGLQATTDLLILGDGPEKNTLQKLIERLNLTDSVQLMGFVKNPYPYISQAIALINASLREGFPNVVVEALSLGTPVLSSLAKTGPKEIIFEGDNGYLFAVGDGKRLTDLMRLLVDSPDVYAHLKENTSKGLERFSQDEVMNGWNAILQD